MSSIKSIQEFDGHTTEYFFESQSSMSSIKSIQKRTIEQRNRDNESQSSMSSIKSILRYHKMRAYKTDFVAILNEFD